MRHALLRTGRTLGLSAAFFCILADMRAAVIFSDDFSAGASPLWGNESGAWVANTGAYYATAPSRRNLQIEQNAFDARRASRHRGRPKKDPAVTRSEEHTSELQSRLHLVCRLLLENKT